jgi:hypothetical protein
MNSLSSGVLCQHDSAADAAQEHRSYTTLGHDPRGDRGVWQRAPLGAAASVFRSRGEADAAAVREAQRAPFHRGALIPFARSRTGSNRSYNMIVSRLRCLQHSSTTSYSVSGRLCRPRRRGAGRWHWTRTISRCGCVIDVGTERRPLIAGRGLPGPRRSRPGVV